MNREMRNKVIQLVEPALSELGYECAEVEWDQVEKALRIFIDKDGGIVMDDCLAVNAALSDLEELDGMISGPYRLEVSSPGVERPLRTLGHFQQVLGQQVSLVLTEKVDGRKKGKGTLESVSDTGSLLIDIDSNKWNCPIELLNRANLVYDWS